VEKKGKKLFGNFCHKYRHTREKCWRLNGKPPSREWGNEKPPDRDWGKKEPWTWKMEALDKNNTYHIYHYTYLFI